MTMKKSATPKRTRPAAPKSSGGSRQEGSAKLIQATADVFEREGLGVAPKE